MTPTCTGLHTYIGCHSDFHRFHDLICDAAREKSGEFKYLKTESRTAVENELIKPLSQVEDQRDSCERVCRTRRGVYFLKVKNIIQQRNVLQSQFDA